MFLSVCVCQSTSLKSIQLKIELFNKIKTKVKCIFERFLLDRSIWFNPSCIVFSIFSQMETLRPVGRSLDKSVDGWVVRSVGECIVRSVGRSVGRYVAQSVL